MSQLAQLQADFQAYLIDDIRGRAFTKAIVNDTKVGVKKRLSIYADAYRLRIIEALANTYPKLKALLGEALFNKTARSYIVAHTSTFRNMRWYGHEMRAHLLYTLPEYPIAAEMAAFEWALGLAFDAEDTPILALQDLANIPPENWADLRFKFQSAIQVLPLRWNTIAVWKALDAEEQPPVLEQLSIYTAWLIWRKNYNSQFRSMEELEVLALDLAMTNASFGETCEKLLEVMNDDATMLAAQYLAGWLEAGMISELQA